MSWEYKDFGRLTQAANRQGGGSLQNTGQKRVFLEKLLNMLKFPLAQRMGTLASI